MNLDKATLMLLRDQEKRWAWIAYQLKLQGSSIAKLAKANGVAGQTMAAAKRNPYPRMEMLIANALGLEPKTLFPDRYTEDGLPLRMFPQRSVYCLGRKHITPADSCNVQAVEA